EGWVTVVGARGWRLSGRHSARRYIDLATIARRVGQRLRLDPVRALPWPRRIAHRRQGIGRSGSGRPFIAVSQWAGPDHVPGPGWFATPATLGAEQMIRPAHGSEVDVDRQAAAGMFDGVVGVAALGGYPAAGEQTSTIAHADPSAQRCAGQASAWISI